ncbi:MAG: hypothetical protein SXQ77_01505 [Halobacteria archaeon]|nr:hypothetical protein [Halobacteria archaeon]
MSTAAVQDQTVETTGISDKQARILGYLEERVDDGKVYFKSKFMSDELDMSPKEIGANMLKLSERCERLSIEKWSYASATTWKVQEA